MSENRTCILCEGLHDRSFWGGWLKVPLGCTKADLGSNEKFRTSKAGGQHIFQSLQKNLICVKPCFGVNRIIEEAKYLIGGDLEQTLSFVLINYDPDSNSSESTESGKRLEDIKFDLERDFQTRKILKTVKIDANNEWLEVSDTPDSSVYTRVGIVRWEVLNEQPKPGLPEKQCLERLVCAAILKAYPERGQLVHDWLLSIPIDGGVATEENIIPKAYSWSQMSGWFPKNGCDDFFQAIWRVPKIATQLEAILSSNGSWRLANQVI